MEQADVSEEKCQIIKQFFKNLKNIDISERQEFTLKLYIKQNIDNVDEIISYTQSLAKLSVEEISKLKSLLSPSFNSIGFLMPNMSQSEFITYNDNRTFLSSQNQSCIINKPLRIPGTGLELPKSQKYTFKNQANSGQSAQPPQTIHLTQQYTFKEINHSSDQVIFDQIKDQKLTQSPYKIICNEKNIDRLVKSDQFESKCQPRFTVVGYYGDFQLSCKKVNDQYPQLNLSSYEWATSSEQDQIVAFTVRSPKESEESNIVHKTMILIYREGQSKQKSLYENEDSIQLIRYMLDVCHIFILVLPNQVLSNWKTTPQFQLGIDNGDGSRSKKKIEISYQIVKDANQMTLFQKRLDEQRSEHNNHKVILPRSFSDDAQRIISTTKQMKVVYTSYQIEQFKQDIQNIRWKYDEWVVQLQNNGQNQQQKIESVKQQFLQSMNKIKQCFLLSKILTIQIEGMMEDCTLEIELLQDKLQINKVQLIADASNEIFQGIKEKRSINTCCEKRGECSNNNNCKSIFDLIIDTVKNISENIEERFKDLNEYLKSRQFSQLLFSSLCDEILIKCKGDEQEFMVVEGDQQLIMNEIINHLLSKCKEIESILSEKNDIQLYREIFNKNLLEKIFLKLDELKEIKLPQTEVHIVEYQDPSVSQETISLQPLVKELLSYFICNKKFDFFITTTYSKEELPEDNQNFVKEGSSKITQIWRYNKEESSNKITLLQSFKKSDLIIEMNFQTYQWIVYDPDSQIFQVGSVDAKIGILQSGKSLNVNNLNQKLEDLNKDTLQLNDVKKIFVHNDDIYLLDSNPDENTIFCIQSFKTVKRYYFNGKSQMQTDDGDSLLQFSDASFVLIQNRIHFALIVDNQIQIYNNNSMKQGQNIELCEHDRDWNDIQVSSKTQIFILLCKNNQISIYHDLKKLLPSENISLSINRKQESQGNLIIDKLAQTINKFGPPTQDSYLVKNQKIFFFPEDSMFSKEKVAEYINHKNFKSILEKYCCGYQYFGEGGSNYFEIKEIVSNIRQEDCYSDYELEYCLKTRVPIHISTFKNFEYQALKNGILEIDNVPQTNFSIQDMKNGLEFGWYDYLLNYRSKQNNTFIISIFGEQSVGKSSQLNRLFNSRFGVSAARCTDGIWMSLSQITQDMQVILLDCEGIFSTNRTQAEEQTLMRQISMVSDIQILFTNLSGISLQLHQLLEQLQLYRENNLSPELCYTGDLIILTKGVQNQNDQDDIQEQYDDQLQNIQNINVQYQFLPDFSSDEFLENLNQVKERIKSILEEKKNSVRENLYTSVLDTQSDAQYQFQSDFKKKLTQQNPKLNLIKYSFCQLKLNDDMSDIKCIQYKEKIISLQKYFEEQICSFQLDHNNHSVSFDIQDNVILKFNQSDLVFSLNPLVNQGEQTNLERLVDLLKSKLSSEVSQIVNKNTIEQLAKRIIDERTEKIKEIIYKQLDKSCDAFSEFNTNFESHINEIQRNVMNSMTYCKEKCSVCQNECQLILSHSDEHYCKNLHLQLNRANLCSEKCCDFERCQRRCSQEVEHSGSHKCISKICHQKCQLCNENCSLKIDHDEDYHLCSSKHTCPEKCEKEGVCQIKYESKKQIYKNKIEESIEYLQYDQMNDYQQCGIEIPPGLLRHEDSHNCNKDHQCDHCCPDCGAFCQQKYNHTDKHRARKHRNMKSKFGIVSESVNKITIINSENQKNHYYDGDEAKPEECLQSCQRLGRGHTHFLICEGEFVCAQRLYGLQNARCSTLKRGDLVYDELTCEQYWKHFNWSSPLEDRSSQKEYRESKLCNWACAQESHEISNKQNYCKLNIWHDGGHKIDFNQQDCKHYTSNSEIDICFTIDTTGSMQWAVNQVKEILKNLISSYNLEDYNLRVAIVGYRDHPPEATEYITKVFSNLEEVSTVLPIVDTITVDEGGDAPEAVIDGLLATANEIKWRNNSAKYVFHIFDAPPHGKETYGVESNKWNKGCLCNKTITDVTKVFKTKNIMYHMIQCHSCLEQTKEVFQKNFANLFLGCIQIDETKKKSFHLSTQIEDTIAKRILSSDYYFYQIK